jgi:hypothetical protein
MNSTSNLTHRVLEYKDVEWVTELAKQQVKHMGFMKDDVGFDDTMDTKEYWEDWIVGENKKTYATFKDGKFACLSSCYFWGLMPYATRKNAISAPGLGFAVRSIFPNHEKYCFDQIFEEGRVKIYMASNYDMYDYVTHPKRRIVFENFNKLMNESWTHCIEEIVEPGQMTKWKGFQSLTGYKTWPEKIMIKSWTHKDYGIH